MYETREFSLQSGFVTGTLKIPVHPSGPKPVVLRPLVDDLRLLERGIAVVSFDVNWLVVAPGATARADERQAREEPGAGAADESVGRWLLSAPRPGLVGRDYFELIAGEARFAVPAVLDHLEAQPGLDPRRMAIGGSSTTGFVALEAFARDARLAVAVARVACGDYHRFLRDSSLALDGNERWLVEGELELDPDYEASLGGREPIHLADALPPRPLLMLNGAADPAIPVACARETARRFGDAYARAGAPERFRFVLYEDRAHDLGPQATLEILAWWERWLAGH